MPAHAERIHLPASGLAGDSNIHVRHGADHGRWVWHPACAVDQTAILRFHLEVESAADEEVILHVSADQRYQLSVDGVEVGYGPDRGDFQHWGVASYRLRLGKGRHRLEALVWWLAKGQPAAQMTIRGGFLVAADGQAERFNTGVAPWQVERLEHAFTLDEKGTANHCGYAGWAWIIDAAAWAAPRERCAPVEVGGRFHDNPYGEMRRGWRLEPSILPEQLREILPAGRIRAVWEGPADGAVREGGPGGDAWEGLLAGRMLEVPARTTINALIDLGTYQCCYPLLALAGAAGATVQLTWMESLFLEPHTRGHAPKGQRDAVDGKFIHGVTDTFRSGGTGRVDLPALWWRAGRFVHVRVVTAAAPLRIDGLAFRGTRYPLQEDAAFRCDDGEVSGIWPILVRGLQMSAHETWVDCPYYEQLMYVGDTRTEALTALTLSRDDRLSRRCLELFDWSRWATGWVAERYPSDPFQASSTYALIWPLCVHDHWQWRGDVAFTRERLIGIRQMLELALAHRRDDGRCGVLPGWSFVDWVPGWKTGMGPGVVEGDSSILDLHLILALQAAADLEDAVGEAACATRWRAHAQRAATATVARFWNDERGLLADTVGCDRFSEHAQCLALIAGILDPAKARRCLESWLACADADLARATIYFSYYPLEALARAGRGDEIVRRLAFWRGLQAQGFTTTVEAPEPARSDCHGWGAHPIHHLLSSIAGIRPLEPGFAKVVIAPQPGPLKDLDATVPHPAGGDIRLVLKKGPTALDARATLPAGITGLFRWQGQDHALRPGDNRLTLTHAAQG